jgi:hypothetical protein
MGDVGNNDGDAQAESGTDQEEVTTAVDESGDNPPSDDWLADQMVKQARFDALGAGRPQIGEMLEMCEREIFKREVDARVWWKAYGQMMVDPVWARQLVTYDKLRDFLKHCDANQAAIAAVLRGQLRLPDDGKGNQDGACE